MTIIYSSFIIADVCKGNGTKECYLPGMCEDVIILLLHHNIKMCIAKTLTLNNQGFFVITVVDRGTSHNLYPECVEENVILRNITSKKQCLEACTSRSDFVCK